MYDRDYFESICAEAVGDGIGAAIREAVAEAQQERGDE